MKPSCHGISLWGHILGYSGASWTSPPHISTIWGHSERSSPSVPPSMLGVKLQGSVMNGNVYTPCWWLKRSHDCLCILTTPQIASQRQDEGDLSSFTASSYLTGLLCVFNWSAHNVMNLYKAISRNEKLSAFPRAHIRLSSFPYQYNQQVQRWHSEPWQ